MRASGSPSLLVSAALACVAAALATPLPAEAQGARIDPVTDAELQNPSADEWLMWRRTLDGWGYSPLDEINRDNVHQLRMVWSRGARPGPPAGDAARPQRRPVHAEPAGHHSGDRRGDRRPALAVHPQTARTIWPTT